ncbi:Hypothetical protein CINCED_3A010902 [Cinara cedri]|uniref:Uncharacterized protein n=1 Tax=Cinara cedri TaxID=506608 RepID=A0A5E4MET6_9HEMI|nr:Hypothetical protein CINCED_3A010902 [Cinara cedri]
MSSPLRYALIAGDVLETTVGVTGLTIAAVVTGWGVIPSAAVTSAVIGVYKTVKLLMRIQRRLR